MKKKKIFFLSGFPVAGMKKKMCEKKKKVTGSRLGYCPFVALSHDTVDCIVTQGTRGVHGRPRYDRLGCDTAPRHGPGGPQYGRQCARARLGLWSVSRYNRCIVTGGRPS